MGDWPAESSGGGGVQPCAPRQPNTCRVPGCTLRLTLLYSQRHRICRMHQKAGTIDVEGQLWRYCQQCARLQRLEAFDGGKRSCKESLLQQKARRVQKEQQRGQAAAAADGSPEPQAMAPKRRRAALLAPPPDASSDEEPEGSPERRWRGGQERQAGEPGGLLAEGLCQPAQLQQPALEALQAAPAPAPLQQSALSGGSLGSWALGGRLSLLESGVLELQRQLLRQAAEAGGAASQPLWEALPPAAAAGASMDAAAGAAGGDPLASLVLQLAAAAAQQTQGLLSMLTGLGCSSGSSSGGDAAAAAPLDALLSGGLSEQLQRQLAEAAQSGWDAPGSWPAAAAPLPVGAKLCSEPRQSLPAAAAAAAAASGDVAAAKARPRGAGAPHPNPFLSACSAGAAGLGQVLRLAAAAAAPASGPPGGEVLGLGPCPWFGLDPP